MPLPIDIILQVAIFLAVVAGVLFMMRGAEAYLAVRRRLGNEFAGGPTSITATPVVKRDTVHNPFLLWVQSVTSLKDSADRAKLRRDLALAGFEDPSAPVIYVIFRFALAIGLPLAFIFSQNFAAKPLTGLAAIVAPLLLAGLGLIVPRAIVDNRANARKTQIEHEFPDALDLMVVCVEAGLGLEAAFVRVAEEVDESHPRMAEEFGKLSQELGAGKSRVDALRALAERVNVDAIKSFVALLIQTDALGVSIAQSLRTYSSEMREHRFLKAEEKAMRIPVLLTVPLVACLMPVMITALLLPPAIDVIRILLPAMRGN